MQAKYFPFTVKCDWRIWIFQSHRFLQKYLSKILGDFANVLTFQLRILATCTRAALKSSDKLRCKIQSKYPQKINNFGVNTWKSKQEVFLWKVLPVNCIFVPFMYICDTAGNWCDYVRCMVRIELRVNGGRVVELRYRGLPVGRWVVDRWARCVCIVHWTCAVG